MTPMTPESVARRLSWALLVTALFSFMLLSAPALFALGIPYDVPFGAFPAKVHPGSYLLVASWAVGLSSHGNPLRVAAAQLRAAPLLACYAVCMVAVFGWAVAMHGASGLAFIIDTLWMPAVAAFALTLHGARRQQRLLQMTMLLLGLNGAIALVEFALGARLVPLYAGRGDVVAEAFFRSSALLGHPLLNALVTVTLIPAIALLPWRGGSRLALLALLATALLAFGGRSAFVCALALALGAALVAARRALAGRYSYLQLTGGLLAATTAGAALAALAAATGLGERIFKSFAWDSSAAVRLQIWELLRGVRDADLWFGMSVAQIDRLAERGGLDLRYESIENFWLYLLLLLGVIGFVPFVVGIGALATHLWRLAGLPMRAALLVYFMLASGANTLASKSVSLLLLTVAVQCGAAARRVPGTRPAQARRPGALVHGGAR